MTNIRRCQLMALLPVAFVLAACSRPADSPPASTPTSTTPAVSAAALAFRNAVDSPPPGWTGPVFALSHDYPKDAPVCDSPWLKRNVNFNDPAPKWPGANNEWSGYVEDIVNYVKQGQDPDLRDEIGWRSEVGGSVRWFHVPWMAYDGERGREFVHGLTNELSTAESTFTGPGRGSGLHHLPGAALAEWRRPALRDLVGRLLQPVRRSHPRPGMAGERRARDVQR